MATGSVALIYTNAMMGGYDDNRYNLRQLEVVLGAIGNELIFAHELLGNIFLPTNCTDGHEDNALREWRPGRSH